MVSNRNRIPCCFCNRDCTLIWCTSNSKITTSSCSNTCYLYITVNCCCNSNTVDYNICLWSSADSATIKIKLLTINISRSRFNKCCGSNRSTTYGYICSCTVPDCWWWCSIAIKQSYIVISTICMSRSTIKCCICFKTI